MMRWSVQCGYCFYICMLITCFLPIVCSTLDEIGLSESVSTKFLQARHYNLGKDRNKISPPDVLFNKIEFTIPGAEFELNNFHHGRLRRETSGVLKAGDIQASRVKTNSLSAQLVKADRVRARNVKASIVTVGKTSTLQKLNNSRMSGNFVSKRYVKDSEEASTVRSGRNFRKRANLYRSKSRNPRKKSFFIRRKIFKIKPPFMTRHTFKPPVVQRLRQSNTIVKKKERSNNVNLKNRMLKSNNLLKNKKSKLHQGFLRSRMNTEPQISDRKRTELRASDTSRKETTLFDSTRTQGKEMSKVQKRNILLETWMSNLSMFKRKQALQNLKMNRKSGYIRKSSATPVQNTNMLQKKFLKANTKEINVRREQTEENNSYDYYTESEEYESEMIIPKGDDGNGALYQRRLKEKLPSRSEDSVRSIRVHDQSGWKQKESFYSNSDSYESLDYQDDVQVPLKVSELQKTYDSFFDTSESEYGIEAINQKPVRKRLYNAYDKNYVATNHRADDKEREYTSSDNSFFYESEPFSSSSDDDWSVYDSSSYEEKQSQQPEHTEKSKDTISSEKNLTPKYLQTDKSYDKVIKDYYYIDSNENPIDSDNSYNNEEEYVPLTFQKMKIVHTDNAIINSQEHDSNDFYTESKENDNEKTSKDDVDSDALFKNEHTSAESSEFFIESFENWFSDSENI
ncbi:uncharacterized protein DDB_G0283697-like [Mytilus edulis]|uniref:uncharacterized protein DDB_G0283697-like n=1 Tax=Mytilus edulis TaxID=6550 RepID=UPI0039EF8FE7